MDPFIGGHTHGTSGACDVHEIGCGRAATCVKVETEIYIIYDKTTANETFHNANKKEPTENTVLPANDKKTDGTLHANDELDCEGTCTATDAKCDVNVSAASNKPPKTIVS